MAVLGLAIIAFIITGVGTGDMSIGGGGGGDTIATIGRERITAEEITQRAQNALEAARQQNPTLDMATFVAGGGVDQVIEQYIGDRVIALWGRKHKVGASAKLVDGEIASIPAFAGPTGAFDPNAMRALLAQRQISERGLREDIASGAIRRQLLLPVSNAATVPNGLIVPYASLLLEAREGQVAVLPPALMPAGPAPSEAEIAAWYKANVSRYIVPEQRVLRYALFGKEQVQATPSEAEVQAFYAQNKAAYAAREARTFSQAILPDQKAAQAFVAKARGPAGFAGAATQAGFAPKDTALGELTQDVFAKKASKAVADAAFALPAGGISAPIKADLGWYVVKVDSVRSIAARPLAAVHAEIVDALTRQKAEEGVAELVTTVEDAISNGSSFDEIARAQKLAVVLTPPLTKTGAAPEQPDYHAPPEVAALLKSAFQLSPDDDPTVEAVTPNERYALLGVAKIVAAAPAPLAKVRDQVARDLLADRAAKKAKAVADAIVAKVKGGASLASAVAGSGVSLPPVQKAAARRVDLSQSGAQVPPALTLLFDMKQGDTKAVADGSGVVFIVHLDKVTPGDARSQPELITSARAEFGQMLAQDYADAFTAAAMRELGVKRFPAAIARLKAKLGGRGGAAEQ